MVVKMKYQYRVVSGPQTLYDGSNFSIAFAEAMRNFSSEFFRYNPTSGWECFAVNCGLETLINTSDLWAPRSPR